MILQIFIALVDVSLDDDARRDVRRRQTRTVLVGGDPTRQELIDELVHARLLSKDLEHRDGRDVEVVDIIHESLIHNWQRLQDEIAAQRATLQKRARFRLAVAEWRDQQQHSDYLLTGVRLAEAESLAAQDDSVLREDDAAEFYTQSLHQRDAEQQRAIQQLRRRFQWVVFAAVLFIALAGVASWFGWVAQQREATAVAERERAEEQSRIAESRRLAAEANSQLTQGETERALLLAIEAIHSSDNPSSRSPLQAAVVARPYQVQALRGHTGSVNSAAFSPDGTRILTASNDGTARLWPVELDDWLAAAQCNVGRVLTEDEIRTYAVPSPLFFDEAALANRQCPPVYSWEE
nr:WD40 repeat domain-containing protein [Candidatus Oscillochloris fontis]